MSENGNFYKALETPLPDVAVRIADGTGEPLAAGEIGTIAVRGRPMAEGD